MLATVDAIIWTTKGPGKSGEFFFVRSFPPNIGYNRFFAQIQSQTLPNVFKYLVRHKLMPLKY